MENLAINPEFWRGKSVLVTGHTGFKGGWITLWLSQLGARVHGYALPPKSRHNFFIATDLADRLESSTFDDVRDVSSLKSIIKSKKPSVIIHMAAQPLVRRSYIDPLETFTTNVTGTVNILEAARSVDSVEAVINITTDKCYLDQGWIWPYRESDRLGGHDPYSASKACAELATAAYKKSFFEESGTRLSSVRAGNVIGGGDWSEGRLIPDFLKAIDAQEVVKIRSPKAIRPWQHVLEPIAGYLILAERLLIDGQIYAGAWNFGPNDEDVREVSWIADWFCRNTQNSHWELDDDPVFHETHLLKVDSSKARARLAWKPRWGIETALEKTLEWHQAWRCDTRMDDFSVKQILDYQSSLEKKRSSCI